ncbi:hypothetical protein F5Y18DRAFT_432067 [Xylariaceae sp. FL1019]|nr:hypothetical protein F5Y18DRAFT_432067 [Xylariaceae sp. FL1019]
MSTARTNLGPLTEAFTYPSSCTVAVQQCSYCDVFWQGQTCGDNPNNYQGVQDNADCWPPRSNHGLMTDVAFNGWGYYSPGLACPTGYETSCIGTASVDGGFSFQFPLTKGETAVGCCPTGFRCKYDGDGAQTCMSIATTDSFAAVTCSSGSSQDFNYYNVPATATITQSEETSTAVISRITVYAPLFQLNFQETDLPSSSSTNTASSTSSRATSVASAPSESQTASASTGLSSGAKAGIGIGAALGALLLIGAAALFFYRRRRRPAANAAEIMTFEPKSQPGQYQPVQYYPEQQYQPVPSYQLSPQPVQHHHPAELLSYSDTRSELAS